MEFMDFGTVLKIAVFMVGITELVKQFFEIKEKKLKIIITMITGIVGSLLLYFLPPYIFTSIIGISSGVIFYDYILKKLEKMFDRDSNQIVVQEHEHHECQHCSDTER